MDEMLASDLPLVPDVAEQGEFDARMARTGKTLLEVFKEYLIAKNPAAYLADFDLKWQKAK
jgi:hypothetical protein